MSVGVAPQQDSETTAAAASECPVCCRAFGRSPASGTAPVACAHCPFVACKDCYRTYLVDSGQLEPDCIGCRHVWSYAYVRDRFPKTFLNGPYRRAREKLLMDRERALLPDTQPFAERFVLGRRLRQERDQLRVRLRELRTEMGHVQRRIDELDPRISQLDRMREDPERAGAAAGAARARADGGAPAAEPMDIVGEEGGEEERDGRRTRRALFGCPSAGECRGFVVRDGAGGLVCGLCDTAVCARCRDPLDPEHMCDPGAIQTAEMLARDTKPCPSCAVPIHRISGCPQMFCTHCHVSFDWNSLRVSHGPAHNPHYFEWLRQHRAGGGGDAAGPQAEQQRQQMMCGGGRGTENMNLARFRQVRQVSATVQTRNHVLDQVFRSTPMLHARFFSEHGRPPSVDEQTTLKEQFSTQRQWHYRYRDLFCRRPDRNNNLSLAEDQRVDYDPTGNLDVRLRFMLGELTEEQFAAELQRREKKLHKAKDIFETLQVFADVSGDLLESLVQRFEQGGEGRYREAAPEDECVVRFVSELGELVDFCQSSFAAIRDRFGGVVPKLTLEATALRLAM